jgi:hypothetical protein
VRRFPPVIDGVVVCDGGFSVWGPRKAGELMLRGVWGYGNRLKYGVSVTDGKRTPLLTSHSHSGLSRLSARFSCASALACLSWEQTVTVLDELRAGVQARRENNKAKREGA